MSDDLIERLERGVRRQDRKPAENNDAERALAIEAAARIRQLEAERDDLQARLSFFENMASDYARAALRQDEGGE